MIKVSRKLEKRLRVVVAALMMFPLWVFYSALADSAQNVRPVELGQGWYWDRPPMPAPSTPTSTTDEAYNNVGDSLGDQLKVNFAHNHLYVGWDAADETDKREMISGINFDLDAAGVPFGASITKFEVVILEHSTGSESQTSPSSPGGGNHGTVNTAEGRKQGIAACAWPEFIGGDAAKPMSTAPRGGGDCNKKADGTFTPTNPGAHFYTWKFDVTGIMADLWRQNLFTSISLEPNSAPEKRSTSSWIITYHNGAYSEPPPPPATEWIPMPGVTATVEWTPPPDEDIDDGDFFNDNNGGSSSDEETTTQTDVFGEFGGFGDSGSPSDASDVSGSGSPPPVASGTVRRAVAGVSEGPRADFWDIALWAWAAALLLLGVLMFSGLLISSDAVPSARQRGAVGALMERFSIRRET